MSKTAQEAKADLLAAGYKGEPTPEVLRQWGWSPKNPLEGVSLDEPPRTREQMLDDLALLQEEAEAAQIPGRILEMLTRFGARAVRLI